jgi:YbbR domain-containing protein
MKKISRFFGKLFRHIGSFFDKWLITPITKLILRIMEFFKVLVKNFDKVSGKKSTLLVVSLVLAFGVFIIIDQESTVMIDQYAEILYNQPVTAVYNEELYVVEGLPETVDITLIGQRRHIFLAKQSPSKGVSVDLTGLKPGNHKVTLKYTQRLKSLDYKLDPSQVTVTIYEKVSETKSLTYDILHQDNLDSKLYISNVELDRSDVIIKGAQYKLDKVATVKALIDVNNIPNPKAGDITVKDVSLVAYDSDGKIVNVEIVPTTVTATVTITSPSKEVPVKIVPKGTLAFGKAIKSMDASLSKVTVYGDQSAIDALQQLEVEIDVKGLDKDKEYNVTLKKPSGITELSSKTIKVKVTVDNSISKEFSNISVQTENLDSNLKAQAMSDDDRQVTVVVKGSEDIVNSIQSSDITAYIDLKDYGVGEHEVEVKVTGNDLKLSYSSKTKKVKIKITEKDS